MKIAKIKLGNGVSIAIRDDQLPITIGRGKTCDIRIPEPYVSRMHCELYLGEGHSLCLKDTSSNGTTVNNRVVSGESVRISNNTEVLLADECSLTLTLTDNDGITQIPGIT